MQSSDNYISGCDVGCFRQGKDKPDVQWGACKFLYTEPMSCMVMSYLHLKFLLHLEQGC